MTDPSDGSTDQRPWDLFVAVLAHELRNPIAPIRSGLDLLASGRLGETSRRNTITMMQRQMTQLVRLIDDLLDASRISAGSLQLQTRPVKLQDVLQSAMDSMRPALDAKGQHIELDAGSPGLAVHADPARLAQAMTNVLDDCSQYAPRGSRIVVAASLQLGVLRISIEAEREPRQHQPLDHALGRFPQPELAPGEQELGLSLALAKGLLALHGGSLEYDLDDDVRIVYTLQLPSHEEALASPAEVASPAGPGEAAPEPFHWRSQRVLVVDDNVDAAQTLALLLELDGQTVRVAHDGPSGVEQAALFRPDVLVMDIGLPGFDGLEAIRRIAALGLEPRPYVVVLTGWSLDADRAASREAGADVHLAKPVDYAELHRIIESVAERQNPGVAGRP